MDFSTFENSDWLLFIQNLILLISLIIAGITIYATRVQGQKNRTISELEHLRSNKKFREALRTVNIARVESALLPVMALGRIDAGQSTKEDRKLFDATRTVLARYEVLAAAVRTNIYHEDTLKKSYYTTIIETIDGNSGFIHAYRQYVAERSPRVASGKNHAYENILWLVLRWEKNPL